MKPMPAGFFAMLMAAAPAVAAPSSSHGPDATSSSGNALAAEAPRDCTTQATPNPNSRDIVVCAERPNGYRLDPDVLAAKRAKKKGESIRPRNPHESYADHNCATIGPMGCRGQVTVDAITAAAVVAQMAARLSKGQPIGPMFQTQPTESEYQLYLDAKRQREADEAAKAAKAKTAAAQAAADAQHTGATTTPAR